MPHRRPPVLNYQLYVGGKGKANPKLAPVTIGFINGQGGPPNFNFPQATHVIEAEVKMINAELGGVHGHPVKLNECFWRRPRRKASAAASRWSTTRHEGDHLRRSSPSATSRSTRRSRARSRSSAVVTANPADPTAKNAYFLNGSQTSVLGPFGTYTKRFLPNVKTAAIVYPTDPGADTAAFALKKGLQQVGVKVTMIGVPPLATDLLGPATQASSADMIVAGAWLHRLRAVREGDRPDPLHEAGPLDADLHVHSAGRIRGRRPAASGRTASPRRW